MPNTQTPQAQASTDIAPTAGVPTWSIEVEEQTLAAPTTAPFALLASGQDAASASFRALRQRVLQAQPAPRSLLVTSASPGEGKTTCAANLALALCELGRAEVLLLEANTHAASLAKTFGVEASDDWMQTLSQADAARDSTHLKVKAYRLEPSSLSVLPLPSAGTTTRLTLGQWQVLLSGLLSVFDHVVIDGPPILTSADASVLAEGVDGVLVVAAAGRSRATALRQALQQIPASKLLGTVIARG